tara:strand:+ start:515 stop:811 length:297 start_codon:yes stop_codon:yes gene_type:complete
VAESARRCKLSTANCASRAAQEVKDKTDAIFKKMDLDGDGEVTMEEAAKFFKSFVRATRKDPNAAHTAVAMLTRPACAVACGAAGQGERQGDVQRGRR